MNSSDIQDQQPAVYIPDDIRFLDKTGCLQTLLVDHSTGGDIVWATDAYAHLGLEYGSVRQISLSQITGKNAINIRKRAQKNKDEKSALTRKHAEVFTPTWICKLMIDQADSAWSDDINSEDDWSRYVLSQRLEITCGEAPYISNRYDAETGTGIPVSSRTGMLDRKLRLVSSNATSRQEWIKWAKKAMETTYGYEYQGDNLLIARINCLMDICEHVFNAGYDSLSSDELQEFAEIISWNLWQMDGLTNCVPFGRPKEVVTQGSLLVDVFKETDDEVRNFAVIKNWESNREIEFRKINREGKLMKFDYIIGNPPYQEETEGTSDKPLYDKFMDSAYKVSDKVELITPARFLFNAGKTSKAWNKKMLSDTHLKVLQYEQSSQSVFPDTDIKGGIVITYRDASKSYGPIVTFTSFNELNSILKKVLPSVQSTSLDDLLVQQNKWNLEALYKDYPEVKEKLGGEGRERRLTTSIFSTVNLFKNKKDEGDATILGLVNNKRVYKYIDPKYLDLRHANFEKFKVIVPKSNGSGAIGEVLSTPLIGAPLIGFTQSFIAFGSFDDESEANALLKYIKTKFARTMLGTLKITQDNNKGTWVNVPLQDFTSSSDIDWSQSVHEIDVQLYKKYGLSQDEIDFIESHVKEME